MLILDLSAVLYLNVYNTWHLVADIAFDEGISEVSAPGLTIPTVILSWFFFILSVVMYMKAFTTLKPIIISVTLTPVMFRYIQSSENDDKPPIVTCICFAISFFIALETSYAWLWKFYEHVKFQIRLVYLRVQMYGFLVLVVLHWRRLHLHSALALYWTLVWNYHFVIYTTFVKQDLQFSYVLACVSYSCNSITKIISLCYVVHYVARVVLDLVRTYVKDDTVFVDEGQHRPTGLRESVGFLFLSLYTSLTTVDPSKRMVLLELIGLLLVSAIIRSAFEVTEPYLLALHSSAAQTKKRHLRIVSFCLFLLFAAAYMGIHLYRLKERIPFSIPNIITIGQILCALVLYSLYMYDAFQSELWEELDDYVYYIKGACRTFEFVLIVVVLGYRVFDTSLEWTVFQIVMVCLHLWVNVYLPLKDGWSSIKLRRLVNKKLNALPYAEEHQLKDTDDVCAICLEELRTARVTPCRHMFHNLCLRKWLNVQNKCPMCHATILFN